MSQYLTFVGGQVYSEAKRKTLAERLGVVEVKACYVHFAALHGDKANEVPPELNVEDLRRLLTYGDPYPETAIGLNPASDQFFITPRTLSPWSSKATNIAQVCGFGKLIKRIERGIIITIVSKSGFDETLAADLLHDRMTQRISRLSHDGMPNMDHIFRDAKPAPAEIIGQHEDDVSLQDTLQKANIEMGLALDKSEIQYLVKAYSLNGPVARNPYDVELFMFAQVRQYSDFLAQ